MPIELIRALAPAFLIFSLVIPIVVTGFLGRGWIFSVFLGWIFFVTSFLFRDVFSLMLADHFHGRESARTIAVYQPGTVAAIFAGWLPPLISHFIGRGVRGLRNGFGATRGNNRSEQDEALKP